MREQHVKLDGRHFIVKLDDEGPRVVYERKLYTGCRFSTSYYNSPYWSRKHHKVGKPWTVVSRVLEAAENA